MKSNHPYSFFYAQAMLLGMYYDPSDHTFSVLNVRDIRYQNIYDADTLELAGKLGHTLIWAKNREGEVKAGLLGSSDWLETYYYDEHDAEQELKRRIDHDRNDARPDHGQDDPPPAAQAGARSGEP